MNPLFEDADVGDEYGSTADFADSHYQDLPVFPATGVDDESAYAMGASDDDAYQSLAAVSVPSEPIYSEGAAGDNYQALYSAGDNNQVYSMGAEYEHALEDLLFPLFKKGIARPIDTTGR